jgi:FAD:protein FMN transferase
MEAEQRFRVMGSDAHLLVVADRGELLVDHARRRLEQLERRWSRFLPDSEISDLDRRRGEAVPVSWETRLLVERSIDAWRLSGGRVDPTVLDDLRRAGYDRSFEQLPHPADEVGGAGAEPPAPPRAGWGTDRRSGCGDIEVATTTVRLPPGHGFDPGGLGKGLAADLVVEELRSVGAIGVCVNLGGDLRVAGCGPGGESWTVAVEHPRGAVGRPIVRLGLCGGAVATSSTLHRRWHHEDGPAHHLVDPATGRPAESDIVQATAVAAEAWVAEALAKDVVLRGRSDPFATVEAVGAQALAVDRDGRVLATDGLHAFLGAAALPSRIDDLVRSDR